MDSSLNISRAQNGFEKYGFNTIIGPAIIIILLKIKIKASVKTIIY